MNNIKLKYNFIKAHKIKSYEFYEEIYDEILNELKLFNKGYEKYFKNIKATIIDNNFKKYIVAYIPKDLSIFFKQYIIMVNYDYIDIKNKNVYPVLIHYEIEGEDNKEKIILVHNLKSRKAINLNFILNNGVLDDLLESYKKYIMIPELLEKRSQELFELNIMKTILDERSRMKSEIKKLFL